MARPVEKVAHRRDPLGARPEGAMSGDAHMAVLEPELRRQGERDVEPVGRQEAGGAVRPFEQGERADGEILEAELGQFVRARDPVEIGMHHGKARQLVGLHDGEGRARDLDCGIAGEPADQGAREGGLAGAEVPGQRDQVARLDRDGDILHQPVHRLFVRQHHGVS